MPKYAYPVTYYSNVIPEMVLQALNRLVIVHDKTGKMYWKVANPFAKVCSIDTPYKNGIDYTEQPATFIENGRPMLVLPANDDRKYDQVWFASDLMWLYVTGKLPQYDSIKYVDLNPLNIAFSNLYELKDQQDKHKITQKYYKDIFYMEDHKLMWVKHKTPAGSVDKKTGDLIVTIKGTKILLNSVVYIMETGCKPPWD